MTDILPYRADYYPLLGNLMDELELADTINRVIATDESQAKIDDGTFTCLLIHNLLGDVNIRLYRLQDFFEDKALPLLTPWKRDIELAELNDDRAGRVLDAIWNADPQKVFSAVSAEAIRIHQLDTSIIHGDTTSKSFYGVFDDQDEDGIAPIITYGYPKDHRPDLKQLLFGVGTTPDCVPILCEIANGNTSDKRWNGRWVKTLRSMLRKDTEEFLLYIADSALVTSTNLSLMREYHIDFISRMPGLFNIEEELKHQATAANEWTNIGRLSPEKNAASYDVRDTTGDIEGIPYRFVVVRSDHKDKRKLKALNKAVKREHDDLTKHLKELNHRRFVCRADAEIEAKKFLHDHSPIYHRIVWDVEERNERVKRQKKGRPTKDEPIVTETNYYLVGEVSLDEGIYDSECELCGLFVLITSLEDVEKYPAELVLKRYKGQGNVERIFRFIKNPAWVGSFCLKKPERLAALGYVVLIAAIVYTLWERRVRKALSDPTVAPIEGLDRKKTKNPTSYALQTVLSSILVLAERIEDGWRIWLPKPLKVNQARVCELSGFSDQIYCYEPEMEKM